ncbi:MAG: YcgN family cysteine cluster protein [Candidatus Thiodiazotropha sp.]
MTTQHTDTMTQSSDPFWKRLSLDEMTREQWESLCDGCAKCCLQKLEDEDTSEIFFTNIVCDLLDLEHCRCTHYEDRSIRVPNCVTLTTDDLRDPYWLPPSCAYRLLAEHKDLPDWHPLNHQGDTQPMILGGHTIRGRVVREEDADDWEHHLIDWV